MHLSRFTRFSKICSFNENFPSERTVPQNYKKFEKWKSVSDSEYLQFLKGFKKLHKFSQKMSECKLVLFEKFLLQNISIYLFDAKINYLFFSKSRMDIFFKILSQIKNFQHSASWNNAYIYENPSFKTYAN